MRIFEFGNAPFPELEALGMRVVDAEDAHAALDPELEHALQLLPERLPLRALEIERVDILVLLRRVLGVLDGAVGAAPEPLGVLAHIWMVGRALESDVECDSNSKAGGFFYQEIKITERPEIRVNSLVPALSSADG